MVFLFHQGDSFNLIVLAELEDVALSKSKSHSYASNVELLESPVFQLLQPCPYCDDGKPRVNVPTLRAYASGFAGEEPLFPDMFQVRYIPGNTLTGNSDVCTFITIL